MTPDSIDVETPASNTSEGKYCACDPGVDSPAEPTSLLSTVTSWAVASCAGFVWGVVFEKSRVFEIRAIRGQMVFERWVMLKLFMAAMGTSALSIALVCVFKRER